MSTNGIALLLYTASQDQKKEYILKKIQPIFSSFEIENSIINLSESDSTEALAHYFTHMLSIPNEKKHLLFSLDGDGFTISIKDGILVDNIPYNVFSYLTKHPKHFNYPLSQINSWAITLFTANEEEVSYIEHTYPQLDGTEKLLFPAFLTTNANRPPAEKECDVFFLWDYQNTAEEEYFFSSFLKSNYAITVYGANWQKTKFHTEYRSAFLPYGSLLFQEKLEYMGNSKITIFSNDSEETEVLSAIANGSVSFTSRKQNFETEFKDESEIFFFNKENLSTLSSKIFNLLNNHTVLEDISKKGSKKAKASGDISLFVQKILNLCK